MSSGFDKHVKQLFSKNRRLAKDYWTLFSQEPISTQIAILRRERGLSQVELAKRLHVSQPQVARFERHGYKPTLSTLEELSKILNCKVVLLPKEVVYATK